MFNLCKHFLGFVCDFLALYWVVVVDYFVFIFDSESPILLLLVTLLHYLFLYFRLRFPHLFSANFSILRIEHFQPIYFSFRKRCFSSQNELMLRLTQNSDGVAPESLRILHLIQLVKNVVGLDKLVNSGGWQ